MSIIIIFSLIAVDIDDKKLEIAKRFGATHTINSKKVDVVEEIKKITKGHTLDKIQAAFKTLANKPANYVNGFVVPNNN